MLIKKMLVLKLLQLKQIKELITVILFHIGGVARRDLSDTVITSAANGSSLMLVVKTGNADNLFTNLCHC